MKKLVLSLSLVVGVASAAHAQTSRFGVKAGVGFSNVTGNDASAGTFKSQLSLQAGAMADISLSRRLAFHPELLFSQKGAKIEGGASYTSTGGTYVSSQTGRVRLAYLDLPLLLRGRAGGAFFELGPQVGLLLSREFEKNTTTVVTYTGNTNSVITTQNEASSGTDGARKLDVGYVLGVGYRLPQGLELGLRYNGGLAKLADGSSAPALHNSAFQLQVGYLLGAQ